MEKIFPNIKNSLPFWSWNDKLESGKLIKQIEWMKKVGFNGFFMHARGGLKTEYLGDEWMKCIELCSKKANELGMQAWIYDENGWPSGFAGGKLLVKDENRCTYVEYSIGKRNFDSYVSYDITKDDLRVLSKNENCDNCLNVFICKSNTHADVLCSRVVDEFIEETHNRYKNLFGDNFTKQIAGVFTDEPTYNNFPHGIEEIYKNEYNENLIEKIGLLFIDKKGYRAFRYKYYTLCQKLFIKNYVKKINDWCESNGIEFTGHYVEEAGLFQQMLGCLGTMPLYANMTRPGMDWLCRRFISTLPVKQLVSVVAQLDKKDCISESYGMSGWDTTPNEIKAIADFQMIYGVTSICQHLFPYSETAEKKYDHPLHFTPALPWINDTLPKLNAHINELGYFISNSKEKVQVGIIHPMKSAYSVFHKNGCGELYGLDGQFREFSEFLANEQIAFHYIDEELLAKHGGVKDDVLYCGSQSYKYIILTAYISNLSKTTDKMLQEYLKNGGKILIVKDKPCYLEGEKHSFDYLNTNTTIEEIKSVQEYSVIYNGGLLRSVMRKQGNDNYILALNIDYRQSCECNINVKGKCLQVIGEDGKGYYCNGNLTIKPLQFVKIKVTDNQGIKLEQKQTVDVPTDNFEVLDCTDNKLVLDRANLSYDGINYSKEYPIPAIFENLCKDKYNGEVYLRFNFEVKNKPSKINALFDNSIKISMSINGNQIELKTDTVIDKDVYIANIAPYVRVGHNEIIVKANFYQTDKTYRSLYGKGVGEGIENNVVYDTFIDVLTLNGDFGVFTENGLKPCSLENVFVGENFYIDKRKNIIKDLIFDGYLFFGGVIKLKTNLHLDNSNVNLRIVGRTHLVKVYLNQNYVGDCDFDNIIDISKFAKVGDNELVLELYTGLRNAEGPFHEKSTEESVYVTSSSFRFFGWDKFTHENYRYSYSFVRTGIFDYDGQFKLPQLDK